MDFTIYKDSWRRASQDEDTHGPTELLNDKGLMCCLGQCSASLGVPPSLLIGCTEPVNARAYSTKPDELIGTFVNEYDGGHLRNTALSNMAIDINDDKELTDNVREQRLTELFLDHNHKLRFVDGKAPTEWTEVAR